MITPNSFTKLNKRSSNALKLSCYEGVKNLNHSIISITSYKLLFLLKYIILRIINLSKIDKISGLIPKFVFKLNFWIKLCFICASFKSLSFELKSYFYL